MLDVCLLGTGGMMPLPYRWLTSLMTRFNGSSLLIDCGEGTQVAMKKFQTGFKKIDVICITHLHGDHLFGLPGLLSTLANSDRTEDVTIIGPIGIENAVEGLCATIFPLPFKVHIIQTKELEFSFFDLATIRTVEADHTIPCISFSIEIERKPKFDKSKAIQNEVPKQLWNQLQNQMNPIKYNGVKYTPDQVLGGPRLGLKVSYVTDTRPTDALSSFIENSDLLLCEGTYGDSNDKERAIKNKHLIFEEAATLSKHSNVSKLILTHFGVAMESPEAFKENATNIFEETVIGHDGYQEVLRYKN